MTYPDPLYSRPEAALSATLTRAGGEPDLVSTSGTEVHYLATGDTTGGLFGLYRWSMGPGRGGADPHFPPNDGGVLLHPLRHGADL